MARRRKPQQEEVSAADLFLALAKRMEQQAKKPNILGYEPHNKQAWFHTQNVRLRLYIGGNRSGKTYGAIAEDIYWASGTHPHIEIPKEQIRGRVVGVDFERGVKEILIPLFKILCPSSYLRGGSWESAWEARGNGGVLWFDYYNSYIEFMSYEQEIEKFAGTSRHFIHYDEEPPQAIFNECQARLVDTHGYAWISMTPLDGMTWVYDYIYNPADEDEEKEILFEGNEILGPVWKGTAKGRKVVVIEVGMNENPHLTEEAQAEYLAGLDDDERAARSKGHFVQTAGKVFKSFSRETHVTTEEIDPAALQRSGWQIYTSTDHGWNAPTAWLWHAVAPTGEVLTFGEHYKSEMTIEEHARIVHAKEAEWKLNVDDIIRTGDPAMNQHTAVTGTTIIQEYAKRGIYIYTDSVPKDPTIGIARMQMYFKLQESGKPTWRISSDCGNFAKELKNLRWKVYTSKKTRYDNNPLEQVHKKDDHAFDSAKYFATFLMDLEPDIILTSGGRPRDTLSYDEALARSLRSAVEDTTAWEIVETYS